MDRIQQLAKPLKQNQIDAAKRFWDGGWESEELKQLSSAFPSPIEAVSIKAIVLNSLYSTNIIAINKVADPIKRVLKPNYPTGPDLIEELVNEIQGVTNKRNYSFAAKYAHFFIDSSLPILDGFAEWMLGRHLSRQMQSKDQRRYHTRVSRL